MIARLIACAMILAARVVTGARPRWIGCAPAERPRIYAANHTSHADVVVLWAAFTQCQRKFVHPVAATDYWSRGRIRSYLAARVFRAILVDRHHVDRSCNPLVPILDALDSGKSIILFPEGTRGAGCSLLPFKSGVYHLAHERPNVEIIPVWIDNLHRILPRGSVIPVPLLCSITFGPPVHIGLDEKKQHFLGRLSQEIRRLQRIDDIAESPEYSQREPERQSRVAKVGIEVPEKELVEDFATRELHF